MMSAARGKYYDFKKICCNDITLNLVNDYVVELEQHKGELIEMIKGIPCTCGKIYKDRGLCSPDCPRCNYIDEEVLNEM